MDLADRIFECMKEAGIKYQVDVARGAGISPPTLNLVLTRRNKKMEADNIISLAQFFKVNVLWLQKGVGPKRGAATIEANSAKVTIVPDRLVSVIEEVERGLVYLRKDISPRQKAEVIARLYCEGDPPSPEDVLKFIADSDSASE